MMTMRFCRRLKTTTFCDDGDHFFASALTLENAFANASHLSYDAVKRSSQRSSPVDVDAVAKEKAARERGETKRGERKGKEEDERRTRADRKRYRETIGKERGRNEWYSRCAVLLAGGFGGCARESATKIHRREEKEGEKGRMKEEKGNRRRPEEKDIVRLESEAAKLKQKQRLIESESEIETKRDAERAERDAMRKEKERAREVEKLRKEVEDAKETLENEQLSHERFVQSMLSDATYWTSEVERRNEKREKT